MINEELLTVAEVLEMAGVSRNTLHRDTASGKIEALKFGKSVRYRKSVAEAYAKQKRESKWVNLWKEKKCTQQKN